jgi:hypothetical protein
MLELRAQAYRLRPFFSACRAGANPRAIRQRFFEDLTVGAHAGGARETFLRPSKTAKSPYARLGKSKPS